MKKRIWTLCLALSLALVCALGFGSALASGENLPLAEADWQRDGVADPGLTFNEDGTLTVKNFGESGNSAGVSYKTALPADGTLEFTQKLVQNGNAGSLRVVILDRSGLADGNALTPWSPARECVYLDIDTTGGVWLWHYQGEGTKLASVVDNAVLSECKVTVRYSPVYGESAGVSVQIFINGTQKISETVAGEGWIGGQTLTLGGFSSALTESEYLISSLTVTDNSKITGKNYAKDSSFFSPMDAASGATFDEDGYTFSGAGNLKSKALPAEGVFTFVFTGTAGSAASYDRFAFGTVNSLTQWESASAASPYFRLVIATGGNNFYANLIGETSETVTLKTPATTVFADGNPHTIQFIIQRGENEATLQLKADGVPQFDQPYVLPQNYFTAQNLWFFNRVTGGDMQSRISSLTWESANAGAVQTVIDEIWTLDRDVTYENAKAAEAALLSVSGKYEALPASDRALVSNYGYYEIVRRNTDAVLPAVKLDEKLAALPAASEVTAENYETVKAAVEGAKADYAALTAEQKALLTGDFDAIIGPLEARLNELSPPDPAKAEAVVALIEALPRTVDADSIEAAKTALKGAEDAYAALNSGEQALVTNYAKLTALQEAISAYEQGIADQAAADGVIALLDQFPVVVNAENIEEAQAKLTEITEAYAGLTDAQKALAADYAAKLAAAQKKIDDCLAEMDRAAALPVVNLIEGLETAVTAENVEAVKAANTAARAAYEALTEGQKTHVENLSKLLAAEKAVEDFYNLALKEELWTKGFEGKGTAFDSNGITFSGYGESGHSGASLKRALPRFAEITVGFTADKKDTNGALRIILLDNSGKADGQTVAPWTGGNRECLILHVSGSDGCVYVSTYGADGTETSLPGIDRVNLADGERHELTLRISPFASEDELGMTVQILVDGAPRFGKNIANPRFIFDNVLTLGQFVGSTGTQNSFLVDTVNVTDTSSEEENLLDNTANWAGIGARYEGGGANLEGSTLLRKTEGIRIGTTVSFDLRAGAGGNLAFGFSAGKYLDINNWDAYKDMAAPQPDGFSCYMDANVTKADRVYYDAEKANNRGSEAADSSEFRLQDGNVHRFTIASEKTSAGVLVTVSVDGREELTYTMAGESWKSADKIFFSVRTNGAKGVRIADFKVRISEGAQSLISEIWALDQTVNAGTAADLKQALASVKNGYEALGEEERGFVSNYAYYEYVKGLSDAYEAELADRAEAQEVSDEIAGLPDTVTADNLADVKARIAAIEAKYDALTDAQKAYVDTRKLILVSTQADNLQADLDAAGAVEEKISTLPEEVTEETLAAVKAKLSEAQAAYEALTDSQKALVAGAERLETLASEIAALETTIADRAAAKAVSDLVAALPDGVTADTRGEVESKLAAVKAAYGELTESQKALVTGYGRVAELEEAIKKLDEREEEGGCNCGGGTAAASLALLAAGAVLCRKFFA